MTEADDVAELVEQQGAPGEFNLFEVFVADQTLGQGTNLDRDSARDVLKEVQRL